MKKILILLIITVFIGCKATKHAELDMFSASGLYENQETFEKLELDHDGHYILFNSPSNLGMDQCEYLSKGKWSYIENKVIQLTSEDYYQQQNGYDYKLNKENKLSPDSLYIKVNFPTDYHPVKLHFSFNYDATKYVNTKETFVVLPKSKYLRTGKHASNQFGLSLEADLGGKKFHKSRASFEIFEDYKESIDSEGYNFIDITLPNFDQCFIDFVSYNQDYLLVRDKKLQWQGADWKRLN